jgi:AmiR/NasT family two-component response regulator
LPSRCRSAPPNRIVIEQAKGAIAQVHGISVDDAFGILRDYARANNRQLSAVVSDQAALAILAKTYQG